VTRPLPQLNAQNEFFWTAGADGVLRIQECGDCEALIHPPQPVCRYCRSRNMGVRDVSGKATLTAFTVNHRFGFPDLPPPYVVAQVAGVTWGLNACRVPMSAFNGTGIRVAVLDTGFDVGHPEFAGRSFVTSTFAGQPVQDLNGHGTHTAGTAAGPNAPAGPFQRYGIGSPRAATSRRYHSSRVSSWP